jgi:hypothetical protein
MCVLSFLPLQLLFTHCLLFSPQGQLGNGRTGEHIVSAGKSGFESITRPTEVKADTIAGKKIVQVACGNSHSECDSLPFVLAAR